MSKGHMQDLQGFRTISSPSASPVDAYGGGVNAPKVSAADQLASAFGTVSKYGQKAAAQAQVEDEKLRQEEAQAFINRYKAEEDGDILTAIKAGELYPQVSQAFLAQAIEKKYNYETQTSYLEAFSKLDDDIVLDDVKLNAWLGLQEDKIREQHKDNPFVLSGALTGFRAAKSQQMPGILGRQAKATKDIDITNINNFSTLTLDKYNLETEEGYNAAVEAFAVDLDNSINTSINENSVVNQTYVDAVIAYAKLNPTSGATRLLSDKRLKHLNTKTTRAKLSEANKVIGQLAVAELERNQKEQAVLNKQKLAESQSKLNQLAVNGDIAGIDRIMAKSTGLTGNDAVLGNQVYKMAEIAKQAAQVKPDVSATNYTRLKDEISVSASLGNAGTLEEEIAKVNARTDIHPNEKAVLIKELPNLLLGNQIIASASHKSALSERLGGTIKTYTDNPNYLVKGYELGKLATSFSDIANETWNQETKRLVNLHLEKNGAVPGYADLHDDGGIYDRAETKVRERLQEVNQMTQAQLQTLGQQQQPQSQEPTLELEVGKEYPSPDGGTVRYLGGDPNDDASFEPVEEVVDPYKVTREADTLKGNARQQKAQAKKNERAKQSVSNIFNEETATFDLTEDTLSTLSKLVEGRYKRASKRRQTVSEDSVMELVLDQLGLDGVSDFEYGGFFGDDADTAGEIAIKKIVDSLMENQIGE